MATKVWRLAVAAIVVLRSTVHAIEIRNFWQEIGIPSFTNLPCYEDGVETSSGPVVFHDNYPLITHTFRSLQDQNHHRRYRSLLSSTTNTTNTDGNNESTENNWTDTAPTPLGCLAGINDLCTDPSSSVTPFPTTTVASTVLSNGKTVRKRYTVWNDWLMVQDQLQHYFTAARSWLLDEQNWVLDHHFGADRMKELLNTFDHHLNLLLSSDTSPNNPQASIDFPDEHYAPVPFVQRVVVPEGSRVAVFGDLHGSYHSFLRELYSFVQLGYMDENFIVRSEYRNSFFILFLGDYVDRGYYGLEVLLTILHIKRHNPSNIFISRGNHEDRSLNEGSSVGDFYFEIKSKYDKITTHQINLLYYIYDTLPSAIFLGVKSRHTVAPSNVSYLLCCHGGIEVGYETYPFLSSPIATEKTDEVSMHYSLIHGFFRQDWLKQVPPEIDQEIPKKYRNLFTNVGQRPSVHYPETTETVDSEDPGIVMDTEESFIDEPIDHPPESLITTLSDENDIILTDTLDPSSLSSSASPIPPVVTNPGWDYYSWPRQPTGTHPHNGFMWNDFIIYEDKKKGSGKSAHTGIYFRPGRGIAYGKTLTEYYLNSTGIVGILRAHQHNNAKETGPMLDLLKEGTAWNKENYFPYTDTLFEPLRGMADIWEGASKVLTFLSGSYIPGFDYGYDSYGLLSVDSTNPYEWTIDNCVNKVGDPYLVDIHKGIRGESTDRSASSSASSSESILRRYSYVTGSVPIVDHEQLLTVNHACNIDTQFVCTRTPWKIKGFTANDKPKEEQETWTPREETEL